LLGSVFHRRICGGILLIMSTTQIRFDDGAAYDRYMGVWSRSAGEAFLDWLNVPSGLRWLDVGCGAGAFTEMIVRRCAPSSVAGIDPSEAQLAFARKHPALSAVDFRQGDAMALPFGDDSFDAAVMPLVIFFVPQPPKGVAEMARVVRGGGTVGAYAWDVTGGGFPYDALWKELRAMGLPVPTEPSRDASRLEVQRTLWTGAGLVDVETRALTVQRTFANFDDYWTTILGGPSVSGTLKAMPPDQIAHLQSRMREVLPASAGGEITLSARANAVKGRVR
jgi:SAM-dependent methyltransferase